MTEEQEQKSRRIALITSIGVHGVLLLLLLFIVAWRAPNPPLPEYGIELNFGTEAQGSGEVQPETPMAAEQADAKEETEPVEEILPMDEIEEEVIEEPKPAEAETVEPEVVSKTESPVVVKEKEEVKPVEKSEEKPVEKIPETKAEEKPKEVPKAVYKPNTKTTEGATNKESVSQGDDANETGDKGNPEGTLDAKGQYGKQGGGAGGVSMSGFKGFEWPTVETPGLPDESYGVYEFIVKVDDQGTVISVTPLQRGLSLEAERRLKAAIQRLQFVPTGSNLPEQSEGKITFRVVSSKN